MSHNTIKSEVINAGAALAKADAAHAAGLAKAWHAVGLALGINPTYELADAVRAEFKLGYGGTPAAQDKAWSRLMAHAAQECGFEFPKSQSKAAKAKAEQREKGKTVADEVQKAFDALKGTTAEKLAQCANLIPSVGLKVAAMVLKEDQANASAEKREAEQRRKALAKALSERLKDAPIETLLKIEAAMDKLTK